MTQEEKELLLKELCARLRYRPHIDICDGKEWYTTIMEGIDLGDNNVCGTVTTNLAVFAYKPEYVKIYLRPMSSMTDEEKEEYRKVCELDTEILSRHPMDGTPFPALYNSHDWLDKKMFDYRGLIPMGLAIEAPEYMYDTHKKKH